MSDLTVVLEAAQKWADELSNYIINDAEKRGDDEAATAYSAELDTVHAAITALTEGVEAPTPDTSIDIYLTGDKDGPDMFGVIYDDEDGVLEAARENEECAWRVPVQPNLDKAELVYEHKEED
jgi:hypothetical protein